MQQTASLILWHKQENGDTELSPLQTMVVRKPFRKHIVLEKAGVKILYGVEANVVDDGVPIAYNDAHEALSEATYVVFDVETTGLSAVYDTIIELAAVKMYKGNVIESFDEFIDPGHPLSRTTVDLTGITDEMVRGSKSEEEVLRMFLEFSKDTILVAHNAAFDMGFLNTSYARYGIPEAANPVIDTLELARYLYPQFKRFGLGVLSKSLVLAWNSITEQSMMLKQLVT